MDVPLTVTDAAARVIRESSTDAEPTPLRITISAAFQYDLRFDAAADGDVQVVSNGITVLLDADSASRAAGLTLDYQTEGSDGGFAIDNPSAPAPIAQMSATDLKALRDAGESFLLVDVRTPGERAIARIEGSRLLDQALHDELMQLPRQTPIVFQCHHGMRSQAAAEYFQRAGFRQLYNLQGGIDAWSMQIDPSVPRY